ncbi:glycosyltransferase family 4 protein [Spirosoma endophyticum]|uniref:Glycosyltransferase involved in cell wall bisynthesis n=1 Tax=Spirosoma endophyticum TaxID=662367 RepID=A0A1I1TJH4_9BACT|nr:glycosyltransferase family 1 protein [Spirosoma endophyticum]SFD55630.1 Glycosyltransferase involved in cell wall bisynthesis [Spirosoma endophyticum]
MDIFFDHQTFTEQNYGGISRYFSELIAGINKTENDNAYVSLLFSNNIHIQESGVKVKPFLAEHNVPGKQKFIREVNHLFSIAKLHIKQYDVFHATYYDPYFIPHLKKRPLVVTFLDMIHEKFSGQFPELSDDGVLTKYKQTLADRADRIIAISESTKTDIVNLLNVDPTKIEVIYLGNSLKPLAAEVTEKIAPEPYLLFVGRRERYKNFKGLLYAVHPILKKYKLKLLCAGGGPFTNEENSMIHSVGVNELVSQLPVNGDKLLQKLYQQATAFIFPTLYEGFGIPVLEAFACNCPCIISNLSSLPEVAGNAALYIDPILPDSISNAIERLLNEGQLRQMLIKKGREQLNNFSWNRTVVETLNLYKTII